MSDTESHQEEYYDEDEEFVYTIEYPEIASKYMDAARVVNEALNQAKELIVPGKSAFELCCEIDSLVEERSASFFKKKSQVKKGLCVPTCLTINEATRWVSPDEGTDYTLSEGDLVKVEVGVHMDGEVSSAAFTTVCGVEEITGRAADVMCAAYQAGQAVYRMLRPGTTSEEITDVIGRVANAYDCNPVQGSLSHIQQTYVITGNGVIANKVDPEYIIESHTVGEHEVYGISILMSTGTGVCRSRGDRPQVWKRDLMRRVLCRNKASRAFLAAVQDRFENFPFAVRAFRDNIRLILGLKEPADEGLIEPMLTLHERRGELVAHYKFTVLVYPNHNLMVTDMPELPPIRSEHRIEDEEILEILSRNVEKKRRRRNRKKKAAAPAQEEQAPAEPAE